MPIQIKCQCGKALNIPDGLAGKAVKCPGCSKVLKVPATGGAASQKPAQQRPAAKPAAIRQPAAPAAGGLDDMFDEEGFSQKVDAVCPHCRAEMKAGSVLCTKCGFHSEHGSIMKAHLTAGVDISHGTLALMKAETDMASAAAMQAKLIKGAGLPWWGLALVLFMLISGITLGVLVVNASRRIDEDVSFDAMRLFLQLTGGAFLTVGLGAISMISIHAFKQDKTKGFLTLTLVYLFYHVFRNFRETWRFTMVGSVCIGVAVACLISAANR